MSRFPRPAGAIENVSDLKIGDHIWHVYGIWPPQMGGEFTITRTVVQFQDHPDYSEIHSSQAELLVFDEQWADSEMVDMAYASDSNMQPGHSHNDNYCFRSEEEALAAIDFLTKQWEAAPDLISEEVARREEDRRYYDYYGD